MHNARAGRCHDATHVHCRVYIISGAKQPSVRPSPWHSHSCTHHTYYFCVPAVTCSGDFFSFRSLNRKTLPKRPRLRVYREIMQKSLRTLSRANRLCRFGRTTSCVQSRLAFVCDSRFHLIFYFFISCKSYYLLCWGTRKSIFSFRPE